MQFSRVVRQDVIVAQLPEQLLPDSEERGLATTRPDTMAADALAAWDALLMAADECDLTLPARAHGWSGIQVLLPFGDWPEHRTLTNILDDARSGVTGTVDQADDVRRVHAAHSDVSPQEAMDAVRRSRDALRAWIEAGGPQDEGLLPTRSLLGTLPVLTLAHATAFQIAVSARDLQACGARPHDELTATGLLALVDTTGALAARQRATASMTVRTPSAFLGTGSDGTGWRTADLSELTEPLGPGIIATAAVVIDIASGRASVPSLYSSGQIAVTDLTGLLALAPIIEGVPGIPAGASLARAAKVMNGITGMLGGLFGKR